MKIVYVGWGHIHLKKSLEARIKEDPASFSFKNDWGLGKSLSKPTQPWPGAPNDYIDLVRNFGELSQPWLTKYEKNHGGNPSILITPFGYSIYTTRHHGASLDKENKYEIYGFGKGSLLYRGK